MTTPAHSRSKRTGTATAGDLAPRRTRVTVAAQHRILTGFPWVIPSFIANGHPLSYTDLIMVGVWHSSCAKSSARAPSSFHARRSQTPCRPGLPHQTFRETKPRAGTESGPYKIRPHGSMVAMEGGPWE